MRDKIINYRFSSFSSTRTDDSFVLLYAIFNLFLAAGFREDAEDTGSGSGVDGVNGIWGNISGRLIYEDDGYNGNTRAWDYLNALENAGNVIRKPPRPTYFFRKAAQFGPFILYFVDTRYYYYYYPKGNPSNIKQTYTFRNCTIYLCHRRGAILEKIGYCVQGRYNGWFANGFKTLHSRPFEYTVLKFDNQNKPYFGKETSITTLYSFKARIVATDESFVIMSDDLSQIIITPAEKDLERFDFDNGDDVGDDTDIEKPSGNWDYLILRIKMRYGQNNPIVAKRKLYRDSLVKTLKVKGAFETTITEKKDTVTYLASISLSDSDPDSLKNIEIRLKDAAAVEDDVRTSISNQTSFSVVYYEKNKTKVEEWIDAHNNAHDETQNWVLLMGRGTLDSGLSVNVANWMYWSRSINRGYEIDFATRNNLPNEIIVCAPYIFIVASSLDETFASSNIPKGEGSKIFQVPLICSELYATNVVEKSPYEYFSLDNGDFFSFASTHCLLIPKEEAVEFEETETELDPDNYINQDDTEQSSPRADSHPPTNAQWDTVEIRFKLRFGNQPVVIVRSIKTKAVISQMIERGLEDDQYREATATSTIDSITYIVKTMYSGSDYENLSDLTISFISAVAIENDVSHDIYDKSSWSPTYYLMNGDYEPITNDGHGTS